MIHTDDAVTLRVFCAQLRDVLEQYDDAVRYFEAGISTEFGKAKVRVYRDGRGVARLKGQPWKALEEWLNEPDLSEEHS